MHNDDYSITEEEIQRVEKDIQKSGFPLEIEVSLKLREAGWTTLIHDYYVDEEEGKSRETDIGAYKRLDIATPDYSLLHISLILECKKSPEKPWVFFTNEKGREFEFPQILIKSLGRPRIHKDLASQERWMDESHFFSQEFERKALIPYEPFTHGKGKRIFEASMQVVKALAYQLKETATLLHHLDGNPLFIMYPVIVFDGHLYEYTSGKVTPVRYLQYLFRHKSTDRLTADLVGNNFLIDVFRRDFLPEYVEMLKQESNMIEQRLDSWSR